MRRARGPHAHPRSLYWARRLAWRATIVRTSARDAPVCRAQGVRTIRTERARAIAKCGARARAQASIGGPRSHLGTGADAPRDERERGRRRPTRPLRTICASGVLGTRGACSSSGAGTRSAATLAPACRGKAGAASFCLPGHAAAESHRRRMLAADPVSQWTNSQDCRKASRSALIVSACVVGQPCGNPLYVFSVPFRRSSAVSGPESA